MYVCFNTADHLQFGLHSNELSYRWSVDSNLEYSKNSDVKYGQAQVFLNTKSAEF